MPDFDFGDEVIVSMTAPQHLRRGERASVVGLGIPGRPELTIEYDAGILPDWIELAKGREPDG